MNINPQAIPDELQALPQWVNWRYQQTDKGKTTKVPYNSRSGAKAASNDPGTWSGFETALQATGYDGIGFVLTGADPYAGIDLDHCIDADGVIAEWAAAIVSEMNTYTEITPSGHGLRLLAHGKLPEGGRKKKTAAMEVEMYDHVRYLTMTGWHFGGTPAGIEPRQVEIAAIHARVFPEPVRAAKPADIERMLTASDSELIDAIMASKQAGKFQRLWNGDASAYADDDSSADLALCSMLAFWTQGNVGRIDGLFRQSGLMREKWDRRHSSDGRTYGAMTIERGLVGVNEYYQPPLEVNVIVGSRSAAPVTVAESASAAQITAAPASPAAAVAPAVPDVLYAIDVEKAILGGMLTAADAIAVAASTVEATDFGGKGHAQSFALAVQLWRQGQAVTPLTMADAASGQDWYEQAGGAPWLQSLPWSCENTTLVADYCQIVLGKSLRRAVLKAADETRLAAYNESDVETLLNESGQRFLQISRRQAGDGAESLGALAARQYEHIVRCVLNGGSVDGISTGFPDLDTMTTGLKRQNLVIVAGRPSMGKTSITLQIAYHIARQLLLPVQIFSLEMSKEELSQRYLCGEARVNSQAVSVGGIDRYGLQELKRIRDELQDVPLWIDDSAQTLFQIHARARVRAAEVGSLGLVIVDYLQQVQVGEKKSQGMNRTQQVEEVTRSFKNLARDLNCPVIALSQLSRAVEQREDKRPVLSDLRESGGIEADADLVMFLYRPGYYQSKKRRGQDWGPELIEPDEVIIGKQRNGPVGTVRVMFEPEYARFNSVEG